MKTLNNYLEDKRIYMLITINILLSIFIILEVMIWNDINSLMTPEEYEQARQDWCNKSQQTSTCR
ncbi:MAG: hypothetical protein CL764_01875 [Chloroflexi bacterium]|nr:hypothetical protein [Chloroflexota bacterium]